MITTPELGKRAIDNFGRLLKRYKFVGSSEGKSLKNDFTGMLVCGDYDRAALLLSNLIENLKRDYPAKPSNKNFCINDLGSLLEEVCDISAVGQDIVMSDGGNVAKIVGKHSTIEIENLIRDKRNEPCIAVYENSGERLPVFIGTANNVLISDLKVHPDKVSNISIAYLIGAGEKKPALMINALGSLGRAVDYALTHTISH